MQKKTVLITGAAQRIGASIARYLHASMNLILHYHTSEQAATALQNELEAIRPHSVHLLQADLRQTEKLPDALQQACDAWGHLDVLINNASSFYPTMLGQTSETNWDDLFGSNLKGPFFLSQSAFPWLAETKGCIINIADIHAERPLKGHAVYSMAKAGMVMMSKALARELAPQVRVNAVAPGAILWPEGADEDTRKHILSQIPLQTAGQPEHIAHTIRYLIDNPYVTGQIIAVDGGRSIRS